MQFKEATRTPPASPPRRRRLRLVLLQVHAPLHVGLLLQRRREDPQVQKGVREVGRLLLWGLRWAAREGPRARAAALVGSPLPIRRRGSEALARRGATPSRRVSYPPAIHPPSRLAGPRCSEVPCAAPKECEVANTCDTATNTCVPTFKADGAPCKTASGLDGLCDGRGACSEQQAGRRNKGSATQADAQTLWYCTHARHRQC
jgi:hypothetical protein